MSDLIGIPLLSAFLFVMGGILIGHLLWYRDRGEDLKRLRNTESKYAKARRVARARKYHYRSVQGDLEVVQRQRDELRAEADSQRAAAETQTRQSDEWEQRHRQLQTDFDARSEKFAEQEQRLSEQEQLLARQEQQLSAKEQQLAGQEQQLNAQKQQLAERERELAAAGRQVRDVESGRQKDAKRLAELAAATQQAGDDLKARQATISRLETEKKHLADQLTPLQKELRQVRQQLEKQRQRLEDSGGETTHLRDQLAQLTEQRNAALAQRDQFATERQAVAGQLDAEVSRRRDLQSRMESLQQHYETATEEAGARRQEEENLTAKLQESALQIQTLQSEHDELLDQLDQRTARIQAAIDGRVVAETALNAAENRVDELKEALAAVTEQRDNQQASLKEIQLSTESLREEGQRLADELAEKDRRLDQLQSQLGEQKLIIRQQKDEIDKTNAHALEFEKLKVTADERAIELKRVDNELAQLRRIDNQRQQTIRRLESEQQQREATLQAAQQHAAEQVDLAARIKNELNEKTTELQRATDDRSKLAPLQHQVETLRGEWQQVSNELESSLQANAAMQDRIRQLEKQLHENAAAMRDLRRKRANVPSLEQRRAA